MRRLPLGIDLGTTRIRVCEAEYAGEAARIRRVVVRDAAASSTFVNCEPEYVAAVLEDALRELGTAQRRCVCALGEPDALLRAVTFPKMTSMERERAARFEAARYVDYPADESVVRVHPIDPNAGLWALGIARASALAFRLAALRAAGLKVVAIDHEACALARALPGFHAIVDVGHQRTSLHVLTAHAPVTLQAYAGGADVTRGIERELSLDERTAEKRKRILGTAGGGEGARTALLSDIGALIQQARTTQIVSRVALVGNAARLTGLAADLEFATGAHCEIPVCDTLRGGMYPEDVVRSSAPDWTLAAGLALWSVN